MGPLEKFVLLLGITLVIAPLARRLHLAEPIAFVVGGLLISLVRGFPEVELDPSLVFLVFLPPLLFAQAWFTSWREFRDNLRPISQLAVGLVLFTTVAVGLFIHWLVPSLPFAAGFVLGAIVSPPDAVAVAAVARELHLPKRLVTVMEGESLVNDATGLVAYKFALAALLSGTFSLPLATLELGKVAGGGVLLGLAVGWAMLWIQRRFDDAPWQVALSLITPFVAYLPAERLHLSGVLSVVAAGLYLGWAQPEHLSFAARLLGRATWRMVDFLLNGLVFVLIGLQLPTVIRGVRSDYSWPQLLGWATAVSALVVLLRPAWIFPLTHGQRWLVPGLRKRDPVPPWQHITVLSWAGVRGVVSLAAALAIPLTLPDGSLFPGRDLLIFLTFAVILATLVVQGLSFPWLVRRLKVRGTGIAVAEERRARGELARAALAEVERATSAEQLNAGALRAVRELYSERLREQQDDIADALGWSPVREHAVSARRLRQLAIDAERRELRRLRHAHTISDELVHRLAEELDLEEARLRH